MSKFYLKNVAPKLEKIKMLSLSGAGDKDIAEFIGISQKTLAKYKREFAEFKDAVEQKKNSDALVIKAFSSAPADTLPKRRPPSSRAKKLLREKCLTSLL